MIRYALAIPFILLAMILAAIAFVFDFGADILGTIAFRIGDK